MTRPRHAVLVAALLAGALPPLAGSAAEVVVGPEGRGLSLTVYNADLAVVRDHRAANLPAGEANLVFADISPRLLGETAHLRGDGVVVSAQSVDFDLISPANLLRRSVGQTVTLMRPGQPGIAETAVRARLLSAEGPVLEVDGRVETAPPGRIVYDRLPEGLVAKPTLSMAVTAAAAGRHDVDLTYLTPGLGWRAEYQVDLDGADRALLSGWAEVSNATGASFRDARLSLVAGQVHRVAPRRPVSGVPLMAVASMAAPGPAEAAATEEPIAGSYLYSLPQPVSLEDRQTRRFALLSLSDLTARRELLVDPLPDYAHARVFDPKDLREPAQGRPQTVLVLEGKASGLTALPAGVVRVFARDTTGMPQFIGEDMLAQKAKGEPLRVILGPDNDVSVDRLQTTFHGARPPDDSYESVWQVRLVNQKPTEVVVRVHDQLPLNGEVSEETQPHETINPRHVVWPVKVPAGGEAVLTYKVRKSP